MRITDAVVAANRFGLGAAPGELQELGSDARQALRSSLEGPPPRITASLPASHELLAQAQGRVDAQRAGDQAAQVQNVVSLLREVYVPAYTADALARMRQAVASRHSFLERLVHFWSNHFAVSVDKVAVLGLAGAFEREAIRPHVLGNFADLLRAVVQHPAMLLYLDNQLSTGPASAAARLAGRRGRELGLNENLGREILELHTLGVDGGYVQQDVRELAMIITGWSVGGQRGRLQGGEPGRFHFRDAFHEPGARTLLGKRYAEDGVQQGERALRDLARHPATARHLATKLARHFIADDPPPALVERVAGAYLRTDGDLPATCRALLDAEEAWSEPLAKFKTPADYIHSAWRALQMPVERGAVRVHEQLGQRTWQPGSPAGWPDASAEWDGAAALMKRLEWAQQTGARIGAAHDARKIARASLGAAWPQDADLAVARAQDGAQALTLWLASPQFMRR